MNVSDYTHSRFDLDRGIWQYLRLRALQEWPTRSVFFQDLGWQLDSLLGLAVLSVHAVYLRAGASSPIHTDWRPDGVRKLALQIPVWGCGGSTSRIYSYEGDLVLASNAVGRQYQRVVTDQCCLRAEFTIDQPTFMRVDLPHSAHASAHRDRYLISVRFREDPWHLVGVRDA